MAMDILEGAYHVDYPMPMNCKMKQTDQGQKMADMQCISSWVDA